MQPSSPAKNIDGTLSVMHTHNALLKLKPNERPFILTRSNAPGAGRWAFQ